MSSLNFPTTGLVPNVTTWTVGTKTYIWTGVAWAIYNTNQTVGTLTATNVIYITSTNTSTSTITGGLVVSGGIGVGGSVNIQNTSTIDGAVILTTSTIGSYTTLQVVTNNGNSTTNTILVLNTSNAYNTSSGALVVSGGASINKDLWIGGGLYVGGIPVLTTSTLITSITSGTDISLTYSSSGTITISDISTLQSVTNRGNSTSNQIRFTNTSNAVSTNSGAVSIVGGLGVGGRIYSESVQITDAIFDSTLTTVNTTATITVDTYSINDFRSAKYLIQIDEGDSPSRPGTANFEVIELLLLVDNSANVYATEYAVLTSSAGELGDFAADCDIFGNISLYFTAYNATNKILKVLRTAMSV